MSTASRKVIDDCLRFSAWVAPYIDGELDPDHAVEMEAHVVGCGTCAERVALIRAMRVSLKRTTSRHAPEAFCARMRATVAQERERSMVSGVSARGAPGGAGGGLGEQKLLRLRYAV